MPSAVFSNRRRPGCARQPNDWIIATAESCAGGSIHGTLAMTPQRSARYANFRFRVKSGNATIAGFSTVNGLTRPAQVIQYREGSDPSTIHLAPGQVSYARRRNDWPSPSWPGPVPAIRAPRPKRGWPAQGRP